MPSVFNEIEIVFERNFMIKKAILLLATLLFTLLFALSAHADKSRTVTVLFTGDLLGQITPKRA